MTQIPESIRDIHNVLVSGRSSKSGWVNRGSVLVDSTWNAYVPGGPRALSYPALQKKHFQMRRGRLAEGQSEKVPYPLPLYLTLKWDPTNLTTPQEVIVRVVDPQFAFQINWKPKYNDKIETLAENPDHYTPVTEIKLYDPEWEPSKGP